ncbi:MAG: MAPEG family protein [Alphaproteobacteria bacterium]|nr:MAPEG family protein [Alphaproteobacteria bacterium]
MAQQFVALVILGALGLYFYMGLRVGNARAKYNVPAPATTGHPQFERLYRVQTNTLEWLPLFLGTLVLFSTYLSGWGAVFLGLVWIAGRYLYMEGYLEAPERRGTGFLIQAVATGLLFLGALIGILGSLF